MRVSFHNWARAPLTLRNNSGFSTLEWIIASMVVVMGMLGATQFFTALKSMNVPEKTKRSLASVSDEMKPRLGRWMEDEWLGIAGNHCKVDSTANPMEPLVRDGYSMGLFNRAYIDNVFPKKVGQDGTHPVRTAFDTLVATYKDKAAEHCASDHGIIGGLVQTILGSREAATTFCRCATAVSAYPTLQNEVKDEAKVTGMYACFVMTANPPSIGGAEATESYNAVWLRQNPVIIEGYVSISSSATGRAYECKDLYSGRPEDGIARVDYSFGLAKSTVDEPMGVRGFFFVP